LFLKLTVIAKSLLSVFAELLRPLVRVLIRYGIPYRTALGILRWVYITESELALSRPKKKATVSSISVITGLPRSEIRKYLHRDELHHQVTSIAKYNKAECILKVWSEDELYLSQDKTPLSLSLLGAKPSFSEMVKDHAGTVPYQSILDELIRTGCARMNELGQVQLLRNHYCPVLDEADIKSTLADFKEKTKFLVDSFNTRLSASS